MGVGMIPDWLETMTVVTPDNPVLWAVWELIS